jgi:hypothetical protein
MTIATKITYAYRIEVSYGEGFGKLLDEPLYSSKADAAKVARRRVKSLGVAGRHPKYRIVMTQG